MERFHPIGTPGSPWGPKDVAAWRATQSIRRSYAQEVLTRLSDLDPRLETGSYGALSSDRARYPLRFVKTREPVDGRPWVLVTGGVHGYETSGVQGALDFISDAIRRYLDRVNFVVLPCVSPWGYEVIHRWNPLAIDPNRSFVDDSPCEESAAAMAWIREFGVQFAMHMDLHETTDSDEAEFRPALAARDGVAFEPGEIPDGFYTVADAANPQPGFQAAIIAAVEAVTHIAPPDADGCIIGSKVVQRGVIEYPFRRLGLCAGMTGARLTTTTEVYPDSPRATPEICNRAQVAAVCGGLDHLLAN